MNHKEDLQGLFETFRKNSRTEEGRTIYDTFIPDVMISKFESILNDPKLSRTDFLVAYHLFMKYVCSISKPKVMPLNRSKIAGMRKTLLRSRQPIPLD